MLYGAANKELNAIVEWLKVNRLSLNVKKTHYLELTDAQNIGPNKELKIGEE